MLTSGKGGEGCGKRQNNMKGLLCLLMLQGKNLPNHIVISGPSERYHAPFEASSEIFFKIVQTSYQAFTICKMKHVHVSVWKMINRFYHKHHKEIRNVTSVTENFALSEYFPCWGLYEELGFIQKNPQLLSFKVVNKEKEGALKQKGQPIDALIRKRMIYPVDFIFSLCF